MIRPWSVPDRVVHASTAVMNWFKNMFNVVTKVNDLSGLDVSDVDLKKT